MNPLSVPFYLLLKYEMSHLYSIGNMARTKQTPRNPVLERPLTAMGADVQERRAPSKPATKKMPLGGKQPCKHISHKTIRQKTITGGIKKPHRYRPGLLALQEIRRYQQTTESLIQRTPI